MTCPATATQCNMYAGNRRVAAKGAGGDLGERWVRGTRILRVPHLRRASPWVRLWCGRPHAARDGWPSSSPAALDPARLFLRTANGKCHAAQRAADKPSGDVQDACLLTVSGDPRHAARIILPHRLRPCSPITGATVPLRLDSTWRTRKPWRVVHRVFLRHLESHVIDTLTLRLEPVWARPFPRAAVVFLACSRRLSTV